MPHAEESNGSATEMVNGDSKAHSQFIDVSTATLFRASPYPILTFTLYPPPPQLSNHSFHPANKHCSLQHLTSYPVVSDSISTFKSTAAGQKSINLADNTYKSLAPHILPYAQGPYNYVAPYVAKADSVAADGLIRVDQRFPIVKQETENIKNSVLSLVFLPLRLMAETREYVFKTYGNEYKKCGGDGYVAGGKAMITTGLVVTSDGLGWLSGFLQAKGQEAKEVAKKKTS